MKRVIWNRKLVADNWQLLEDGTRWLTADAAGGLPALPQGELIVPLAVWQARRDELIARGGRLGVWLAGHEDPAAIAGEFAHFDVVAVHFPQFADGRGYSLARLLRERYGYRGELRAVGDILRDQIFYLSRCGFDAFALRADQKLDVALAALDDFSEAYQTAVDRPEPLFRRRLAAASRAAG